jgi:hypothetical protein
MAKEIPEEIKRLSEEFSGSYWNYRWLKFVREYNEYDDDGNQTGETYQEKYYALHEVYYDNEEKPFMWSEEPIKLYAEDAKDMMDLVGKMLNAAVEKVLVIEDEEIKETEEYMDQNEILEKYKGEKKNEKETRRN